MAFTLVAWSETVGINQTNYAMDAVSDPHITVSGDDVIVPPELPNIVAAAAVGSATTYARLVSPTLRAMINVDVAPVDKATEPSSPFVGLIMTTIPITLTGEEALNFQVSTDDTARSTGLVWLADGPVAPVTGKIYTVKCTSATTLTPYEWTNGPLTFTQDLPAGRYQVVGMRAQSAGLIAARLVFPGYAWRPGVIGADAITDVQDNPFRYGRFGVWGEFDHNRPPTVDFLSSSADTSEEVWLDLIKVE